MVRNDLLRKAILEIRDLRKYRRKVAIIGVALRFPGGATCTDSYWDVFRRERNGIREIPSDRWDVAAHFHPERGKSGKMYSKSMGDIGDVSTFDAPFFNVSPREAEQLDPQQRLLLETTYHALESAGYAGDRDTNVGVYIGAMSHDYLPRSDQKSEISEYSLIGTAHSMLAGRLAYAFGFEGPALTLDTACSSSLVALHQACLGIRHDDCALAVVGGVNLILNPDGFIGACQANMLSASEHCHVFSAHSTGYSRAEGCGVVILKALDRALEDADPILAVIDGSAVNQDGRSQGITAPNVNAQIAVMRRCLSNSNVKAEQVGYLESHGTGTPLGDPIEVQAIDAVYARGVQRTAPLLIGASKANIGHAESAAGMAGLIKAILVLQHREAPPILNLRELNEHLVFDGSKIRFPTEPVQLSTVDGVARAAVSSFGFSGTNAHVLLSSAPEVEVPAYTGVVPGLLLSAQRPAAIAHLAERYRALVEQCTDQELAAYCYSSQVARAHFAQRCWLDASNRQKLLAQLSSIAEAGWPARPAISGDDLSLLLAEYPSDVCRAFAIATARYPAFSEIWQRHLQLLRQGPSESTLDPSSMSPAFASSVINLCVSELLKSLGANFPEVRAPAAQALAAACAAGVVSATSALEALTVPQDRSARIQWLRTVEFSEPTSILWLGDTRISSASSFRHYLAEESRSVSPNPISIDVNVPALHVGLALAEDADPCCGLLRTAYESGLNVRFRALYRNSKLRVRDLPSYPFERKSYRKQRSPASSEGKHYPLLGQRTLESSELSLFSDTLSSEKYPFLNDHRVGGEAVFPGAGYLEIALRSGLLSAEPEARALSITLEIQQMLRIPSGAPVVLTSTRSNGKLDILAQGPTSHVCYASAELASGDALALEPSFIPAAGTAKRYPVDRFYERLQSSALGYGKSFRTVRELYQEPTGVLVRVALDEDSPRADFVLHPCLFDGMLQAVGLLFEPIADGTPYVPVELTGRFAKAAFGRELWCRISSVSPLLAPAPAELVVRLDIFDATHQRVAVVERAVFRRLAHAEPEVSADDAAFEIAWRHVPLQLSSEPLTFVGTDHEAAVEGCLATWRAPSHAEGLTRLDGICTQGVLEAFRSLGIRPERSSANALSALMSQAQIQPSYAKLIAAIFGYLEQDGVCAAESDWHDLPSARRIEPAAARTEDAQLAPALELLERCLHHLPAVLRGDLDPLNVLFPDGVNATSIYENTVVSRNLNTLVATAFRAAIARLPADAELTILEIGAGTGSATAEILGQLNGRKCTYFYTDVSPVFLEFAQERFKARDDLVFKLYDLEASPEGQGIPAQRFDVVIGANVLHAVSDLERTTKELRTLLKPGGFLILRELTQRARWLDLTFGLTRNWWSFTDSRQGRNSPILNRVEWQQLFDDCGFSETRAVFATGPDTPENILVARNAIEARSPNVPPKADDIDRQGQILCLQLSKLSEPANTHLLETFPKQCVLVRHAAGEARLLDEQHGQADLFSEASLRQLLEALTPARVKQVVLFDAFPAQERPVEALFSEPNLSAALLALVKSYATLQTKLPAISVVTRSIHPDAAKRTKVVPSSAQIYGTMKVLKQEYPQASCKVIGVDDLEEALPRVARELEVGTDDAEVMYLGSRRFLPYLRPARFEHATSAAALSGLHVVAGGAGGIGRLLVTHLLEQGADGVLILGRRPYSPELEATLNEWNQVWGKKVSYASCDIGDWLALRRTLDRATAGPLPIRSLTYSIGGLLDKGMTAMTWEEFQSIAYPKCVGLYNLHRASLEMPLEQFAVFSSAVTLFGTRGQANHAAANAFLDAFTDYRRGLGLPVLTLNWGVWSEVGAVKDFRDLQQAVTESGLGVIDSQLGKRLIASAFRENHRRLVLTPLRSERLLNSTPRYEPLLGEFYKRRRHLDSKRASSAVLDHLRSLGSGQRKRTLTGIVSGIIRTSLKYDEDTTLEENDNLFQVGVDSLVATTITAQINSELSLQLSAATIFTYPTIAKLVAHVIAENFTTTAIETAEPNLANPAATELDEVVRRLTLKIEG